jgi:hypothetical protein
MKHKFEVSIDRTHIYETMPPFSREVFAEGQSDMSSNMKVTAATYYHDPEGDGKF